ncbi:MAG: DNA polymerase III subunit delta', partial [Candidatus Cloacimonetes bacterium]|nr:DNA polymerase III subunit delta' [Candidatus Cloacimonadota bacterium]
MAGLFSKIRGQQKAIKILEHALETGKCAQSYLFYGPAGTGKFTTALYFGMALNCLDESEARPCGVCLSCRKLINFSHPDFIFVFPSPNLEMTPEGDVKND